jgi:hypothetical protein
MTKQHSIGRIAKNPEDYKHYGRCGKINRHGNKRCHRCGYQIFNAMDDEYGRGFLLDWEKEPDLLLEV